MMAFGFVAYWVAGLADNVFGSIGATLAVILGTVVFLGGVVALVQTRKWPTESTVVHPKVDERDDRDEAAKEAPKVVAAVPRPSSTTDRVRIRFPDIDESHPDVWGDDAPLRVVVHVTVAGGGPHGSVRLVRQRGDRTKEVAVVPIDAGGTAAFDVRIDAVGEHDLVAALVDDPHGGGQAVRAIRVVDYRSEVVETFEDFVAWAAAQFAFVDRKMTAREFVDRFADGRAGTPIAPLEVIADLYELANYSDHAIDRARYLRMVDAFIALEDAGALEGPDDEAGGR